MTSPSPQPAVGDIRFNGTAVEYFDGAQWVLHEELPDDQSPPDLRGHGEEGTGPDDLPFPG
ncbi:hypothetical protein [Streptomyces salinarius]|uniref:hypothetical protein n=1 Tax=Streptomyces salinarius TaxID=2762598 RepID=UPI0013DB83F0|nr:hypothetical protein [Streptomyces salinarius]